MSDSSLGNISLVVVTFNEEESIARCLSSADGVGEIIVVDSFSTDRTVEIARSFGAIVYQREYVSAADQKNWAIGKASKEWILVLDADESLSPQLREEIAKVVSVEGADAYRIRRRNEFFGRVINHCGWGNDWVTRLFRRGKGRYQERMVHEKLIVDGKTSRLKNVIEHKPYKNLTDYFDKLVDYAKRSAIQMKSEDRSWFPQIFLNPPARFIRMYLLQLGFLDGVHGFILCTLASFSVFLKYAFLKESEKLDSGGASEEN